MYHNITHRIIPVSAIILMVLSSCGNKAGHTVDTTNEPTENTKDWVVASPEFGQVSNSLNAQGYWEAQENGLISLALPGAVQIHSLAVAPGSSVKKNEVIAWFSSPELITLQEEFLHSKAALAVAKNKYDRWAELKSDGSVGAIEWAQVETALAQAQAKFQSSQSQLSLYGLDGDRLLEISTPIAWRSPLAGKIGAYSVDAGGFLTAHEPLTQLQSYQKPRLQVNLPFREAAQISEGDQASIQWNGTAITATVLTKSPISSEASFIPLWLVPEVAPEGWTRGAFAPVTFHGQSQESWSLPVEALIYIDGQPHVMTYNGGELKPLAIDLAYLGEEKLVLGDDKQDWSTIKVVIAQASRAYAAWLK